MAQKPELVGRSIPQAAQLPAVSGLGLDSDKARFHLIDALAQHFQLDSSLVEVMRAVPRHRFVEPAFVSRAYDFVIAWWWLLLLALVAAWQGWKRWLSTPAGRERFDRFKLDAPVAGDLVRKLQIARFARTLGTMLKGGVPLIQALDIVRAVVANVVIGKALAVVQREVSEGKGLSGPLEKAGVFPALALQMVGVGEETGRLDDMLLVVSDHYDGEVSQAITRTMALISPVVLIVMGTLTGFIVWAMLSAVFSVNEAIK